MSDLETIKVINTDGKETEIKVVTIIPGESKKFLIYTFDDKKENIDLYASIILEQDDNYVLDAITNKEDWELVQKKIQELAQ